MSDFSDPALVAALATLAAPGLRIGHRVIQGGDEKVLFETEAKTVSALPDKRRASGLEVLARVVRTSSSAVRRSGE